MPCTTADNLKIISRVKKSASHLAKSDGTRQKQTVSISMFIRRQFNYLERPLTA
jgi:hypothetical protein